MRNKISQLWHQHPFWVVGMILAIITGIVVPIVVPIIESCGGPRPDPYFKIKVFPVTQVVEQGGFISTTITVISENGYSETVSLSASGQPAGVVVSIVPPIGGGEPTFTSNVNIIAHLNVSVGRHVITMTGVGSDGMERSVKYTLTVIPGDLDEPPTVIPGDLDKPPTVIPGDLDKPPTVIPGDLDKPPTVIPGDLDKPPTVIPGDLDKPPTVIPGDLDKPPTVIPGDLDKPPTAVVSATPATIEEGESVAFSGVDSTDPDGTIVTYVWNFGDGRTATGPTITHTYSTSGSYTVTLTVTDNDGLSDITAIGIIVRPHLVIKITSPKSRDEVPISTTVRGTISGELPEGQYMWVVINPHPSPGQWWPQMRRIEPLKGQWYVEVWLGEEEDVGIEFDIAVILVNEEDDRDYKIYLARGRETGDYPGIPFPPSANIMDVITVF